MIHTLRRAAFLTPLVAILAGAPSPAQPQSDEFQSGDFGRIRFEENGVLIERSSGGSSSALSETATLNAPIFPGDEIHTGYDQRLEAQLAGGTLIRVDRDSELVFQALPDPYAESADNVVLKLGYGTIQIASELTGKEEFRVDTPDASVYLLGNGDFRIEVDDRGQTRVFSRRGVAEVVGDHGSVLLRGGTRTTAYSGSVPDDPEPFNTFVADDFDRWVEAREGSYEVATADAEAYEEIPSEVRPYYRELGHYGRWVYVPASGYCWYPYDVPAGWRPYFHGYWSYGSRGYFWVSNEPWGWAPYHYGRWNWLAGYGWCWFPGRVFSGAWVSWSWGSAHLGWAPLNPWNQPVWVRTVRYGYYDPACWTFVRYRDFGHSYGRYPHYSVDDVGDDLRNTAVVTRPPRLSPRELATEPAPRQRIDGELVRDPGRRIPEVRADRRPAETFTAQERALAHRGRPTRALDATAAGDRATPPSRRAVRAQPGAHRSPPDVTREIPSSPRGAAASQRTPPQSTVRERPTAERGVPSRRPTPITRRTTDPDRGSAPATPRREVAPASGARSGPARDSAASASPSRRADPSETDARLRSLYRRVSEPRTTEPRGSRTATPPSASRGSSAPDSKREAAPRSATPSSASQRKGSRSAAEDKAKSSDSSSSSSSSSSSKRSGRGGKSGGGR